MQTITSSSHKASSNLVIHFVPQCSCKTHTHSTSKPRTFPQGQFRYNNFIGSRSGLPNFRHKPQRFQMLQGGKKSVPPLGLEPLPPHPQVDQSRGTSHITHCVFLHWSKATGTHAAGDLDSRSLFTCTQITKKKHSTLLKEALSLGGVALQLSCGFRPDWTIWLSNQRAIAGWSRADFLHPLCSLAHWL